MEVAVSQEIHLEHLHINFTNPLHALLYAAFSCSC